MLATAGLLAAAVLVATWVAPVRHATPAFVPQVPAATPAPPKPAGKGKPKPKPLTAAQLAARTEAVATLRTQGYLPTRPADYDPHHELRVLVGYRNGEAGGPRRAFFFAGTRLIGTDSTAGSSSLVVKRSGKRWVALTYGVFAPGAKPCCPLSTTSVRFEWNGSALTPKGTIPLGRLATG